MHLDENITSSGRLVWQRRRLSSWGCYIVPCNVDTQEIEMWDNRRGGTSPVWDMYVSAAWAGTGKRTALGNVCANVLLAAGKVGNAIQGGDLLSEKQNDKKTSGCNRSVWGFGCIFDQHIFISLVVSSLAS